MKRERRKEINQINKHNTDTIPIRAESSHYSSCSPTFTSVCQLNNTCSSVATITTGNLRKKGLCQCGIAVHHHHHHDDGSLSFLIPRSNTIYYSLLIHCPCKLNVMVLQILLCDIHLVCALKRINLHSDELHAEPLMSSPSF